MILLRLVLLVAVVFQCYCLSFSSYDVHFASTSTDYYGQSIATDGETLAVGAGSASEGCDTIFIYEDPLDLSSEIKLPNPTRGDSFFGLHIAMSEGTILVVDSNSTSNIVYFAEKVDGTWSLAAVAMPADLQDVSMRTTGYDIRGDTAMVTFSNGTVGIFRESNNIWTFTQRFDFGDRYYLGTGVTISETQAAFTLLEYDTNDTCAELSLQLLDLDPATGQYTVGQTLNDTFGCHGINGRPNFSPDGTSIAIGAWFVHENEVPFVTVYSHGEGAWAKANITLPESNRDLTYSMFGARLAWVDDATLAVTANLYNNGGNSDGAVLIYTLTEGDWAIEKILLPPDEAIIGTQPQFGSSIAYCSESDALVVGAMGASILSSSSGKIFVFHDGTGAGDGASSDSTVFLVLAMTGGWFGLLALCVLAVVLFLVTIFVCSALAMTAAYSITAEVRNKARDEAQILGSTLASAAVSRVVTPSAAVATIEVQGDASTDEEGEESTHTRHPSQTTLGSKPVLTPARLSPMGAAKLPALLTPPRTMPVLPPMARPGVSLVKREDA
ncbi:hypothetical protein J8273_7721 [Carpediemonas membranifera]|uniref:Membrane-associated protein n=1 Tax=Carpediemonas membranifera TaxID=201153 RepID=A0A8J6B5D1_9EUKA|nr:hypothetical protein J8273_7721 [Carpediemonas membranifera]|eukprot:KAG9390372.1 hypothetical protein J8273_7721 [Carpediemonas membranifera]